MNVKIIILRRVPKEVEDEIRPLLVRLRDLAGARDGYVSGENLVNYDDPEKKLVVSTWKSLKCWNLWLQDEGRIELQSKIDRILGTETFYQHYMSSS